MEKKIFTLDTNNQYDFEDVNLTMEEDYRVGTLDYVRNELILLPNDELTVEQLKRQGLGYNEEKDEVYIPKGSKIVYLGVSGSRDNWEIENENGWIDLYFNLKVPMKVSTNEENFEFEITETLQRRVVVIAPDRNKALEIVKKRYKAGEIVLDSDDFVEY